MLVNGKEIHKFKAKDSEIVATSLCLRNISKVKPQIVNLNGDEAVFFPFSIKTNKCSGSCNNINNPYAKLCIPDVVKNFNVKVFDLRSRTN